MKTTGERFAVIALGGNAISSPDQPDTIANQFRHTRESLDGVIAVLRAGYDVAITHGNGPQIGNALLRQELARGRTPELPLGVLVASTEGWMGYMIEQSLINRLREENLERPVISVVSQVLVDPEDPSLADPTKFIGQVYPEYEAYRLAREFGWVVKPDKARGGFRRVVGSPLPKKVLNAGAVRSLLEQGWIVICAGGGGVPVYRMENGRLEGVDAVIDKDRSAAVLGVDIGADELIILTAVEKVALNYGRKDQVDLPRLTVAQAREYLEIGHFPPGSMGPKIEAAIDFLEGGGKRVIITDLTHVVDALEGKAGTTILP